MTEKPSPGYWMTPLLLGVAIGRGERREVLAEALLERGGVPAAVDEHRGLALDVNALQDAGLRRTSGFVQPFVLRAAHLVSCATILGDVHGVEPV